MKADKSPNSGFNSIILQMAKTSSLSHLLQVFVVVNVNHKDNENQASIGY